MKVAASGETPNMFATESLIALMIYYIDLIIS